MANDVGRRGFLGAAAALGAAAGAAAAAAAPPKGTRIVGIACSPRPGKSTSAAVQACLDAAKAAAPGIETELIELASLSIPAQVAAGQPLRPGEKDDFPALAPKLADPKVVGIIVGSPVYFSNMSALCKAFLDRCFLFRKQGFALSGKVAGAVAVGGARHGGQELTVQSIRAALDCQDLIVVGTGRPSGRIGAMLWSKGGDLSGDDYGTGTAKDLGRCVATTALKLAATRD